MTTGSISSGVMNKNLYNSSSFWHLASSAFFQPLGLGLIFLLHLLLARELSAAEFGMVSFVLTATPFAAIILCMGFPIAATKFIPQYLVKGQLGEITGYLRWSLIWVIGAAVLFSIGLYFCAQLVSNPDTKKLLYYLIISTFPVVLWMWQRHISLSFNFVTQALIPREVIFPLLAISAIFLLPIADAGDAIVVINLAYVAGLIVGFVPAVVDMGIGLEFRCSVNE